MDNNKIESLLLQIIKNQESMQSDITEIKNRVDSVYGHIALNNHVFTEKEKFTSNIDNGILNFINSLNNEEIKNLKYIIEGYKYSKEILSRDTWCDEIRNEELWYS